MLACPEAAVEALVGYRGAMRVVRVDTLRIEGESNALLADFLLQNCYFFVGKPCTKVLQLH